MDDDTTQSSPAGSAPATPLETRTVIAERFTVEALAGRGGMGSVYRATDSQTGRPVALKLMHALTSPGGALRFKREAVLLSELRHPHIVAYVEHGSTAQGQPFLAMEWLEGEDLAQRLARQPLSLPETLALLRHAAEALATAHQQGIVHRDLKPSNLFLRGGRPEDVVLVDFGLARHTLRSQEEVTGTGTVLGTPAYMAPEQASSQPEIPPAADIFSLGCVLYECLTGQPPFKAPHLVAVLAKILFAEPAPLHTLRPGLPQGLQVLVDRMLAKEPQRRLPDAARLLEALSALESLPELLTPSLVEARRARLAGTELQLVSVLLATLRGAATREQAVARGGELRDTLRTMLAPHGGQVELLADGSLVATLLPERGSATDQAMLAARCALAFRERWPEASVVLAMGRGVLNERLPVGEVMDRAGRLLRQFEQRPATSSLVLDEVTAGLLGPGFQLSRSSSGAFVLHGEQLSADGSRPLLGRPTPCVGREQELMLLELTLSSCLEESVARAVLVTAPAGTGKSRLRHEFLRRIERREQPPLVLLGRADPMSAGASYGLLGQALRRLCGVVEGASLEARRARLSQRVALQLPATKAQETLEFLGELCAIPFPEEGSPRLRAARGDPRLMSAQVSRALETFLEAECAHQPVLLVLEDLHWSDALTLKLVDEMLRELAEHPFMVLALARPEVKGLFPNLWARRMQELPLSGLSRGDGARLVREVLGPQVPETVIRRAVEQADGNALFLEELIRMVAEGRGEAPPETVLAVLQARLLRMEPGVRQALLAASLFGRTFWSSGVGELLGQQGASEEHLRRLVEQEVIELQPDSRFPGVAEYRFRHALVRDAAYGLVPDSHRARGHRLAGAWLERMGEPDVLALATHYQLGGQPGRAVPLFIQAAERTFERNDLPGTLRCVRAALSCGVKGEELTRLSALQAVVAFWMDDVPRALELGGAVLDELEVGSWLWCWLVGVLIFGGVYAGTPQEDSARLNQLLLSTTPKPEATAAYNWAIAALGLSLVFSGERWELESLLRGMRGTVTDVLGRGWLGYIQGFFHHLFEARPWQALMQVEQGMRDFRELGLERDALILQTFSGRALAALGDVPGAVEQLRQVLIAGRRMEEHLMVGGAQHFLSLVLAGSPEPEHRQEARELVREWVGVEVSHSYRRGMANVVLAEVLAASGEPREAEPHARTACELLASFKAERIHARTVLGTLLLAQGRVEEARREAELGVRELEQLGSAGVYAVGAYLALAEACFTQGEVNAGEAALRQALGCVRARLDDIPDPSIRERFLLQVPENARTFALARQRWGEAAA